MNIQKLREVITQYISLDANDDFATEKCWKEMTAMLSENVTDTISFFKSECTIEEFYWLSSIFEDVIAKTQSADLISIWRSKLSDISSEKFKQEEFKSELMQTSITYADYIKSIKQEIDFAEGKIEID
jgi:L-rhamnose mutarotase